jgi:hypothetical protein
MNCQTNKGLFEIDSRPFGAGNCAEGVSFNLISGEQKCLKIQDFLTWTVAWPTMRDNCALIWGNYSRPTDEALGDLWLAEDRPYLAARMRLIKAQPGWWRNLPVIDAGMKVFELARELGFSNNVLTKGAEAPCQCLAGKSGMVSQAFRC